MTPLPGGSIELAVAAQAPVSLEMFPLVTGLLGGLALFLYGMDRMAESLKTVAGPRMKSVLAGLTRNRFAGVATGAFVTAVIQSSSVTTVLVVGFISAGLMSMTQSIGVIMGANIGTTVTAQIIAFKVTKYALLMIAAGFAMLFAGRRERVRQYGAGLLGLGLVFFGMGVMGEAMEPLRSHPGFISWMGRMATPGLGILAGAVFTALVQSSSATTGVIIVMAGQGLITLPAGIALAFGANIGTCVTALLAAIGKPREATRAAVVHVVFNVLGVVIWLKFIPELASVVRAVSPSAGGLSGGARLAAEVPRQIANAHTLFNVTNTLLFIWFATPLARFVEWLVPDRPLADAAAVRAKYLDNELLKTPSLALERARLEILHMGDHVLAMMRATLPAVLDGTRESLAALRRMDDPVDALHGHIVTYLGRISQEPLTEAETAEFMKLMDAANGLENIGDIIETNMAAEGLDRIDDDVTVSPATRKVIADFHGAVSRALEAAIHAVTQDSEEAARVVVSMKSEINAMAAAAARHQAQRLVAPEPHRLRAYNVEMDVLENLKRIYYFCKRIARGVAPEEVLFRAE